MNEFFKIVQYAILDTSRVDAGETRLGFAPDTLRGGCSIFLIWIRISPSEDTRIGYILIFLILIKCLGFFCSILKLTNNH